MDGKFPERNFLLILLAVCHVIVVIGAMSPLSQPRIPMNHMRFAHSAFQLIAAEQQYAERLRAAGFNVTCVNLRKQGLWTKCWRQVKRPDITTNCRARARWTRSDLYRTNSGL